MDDPDYFRLPETTGYLIRADQVHEDTPLLPCAMAEHQ